jgi:hypothetical protein
MESCLSPQKVFITAWKLGYARLPDYAHPNSRKDFTLPQLFACLVLKEFLKLSYRKAEAFLKDVPEWWADIEMEKAPHHRTLCDAFTTLTRMEILDDLMVALVDYFERQGLLKLDEKPLAIDSTYFESHHVSRHYEHRKAKIEKAKRAGKKPDKQGSCTRSETVRKLPKLVLAVAAACHLILSFSTATGMRGDQNCLHDVLVPAWERAHVKQAVMDAGFDSEENHRLARCDLNIDALIPPDAGRPTEKMPTGPFRAEMRDVFDLKLEKDAYGQRWQVETVNSMMKRNQGSALRARSAERRKCEMGLRVIVHNIALPSAPALM